MSKIRISEAARDFLTYAIKIILKIRGFHCIVGDHVSLLE